MLHSRSNVAITKGLIAIARAYARMPGFDRTIAKEIAHKIEPVIHEHRNAECVVALVMLLLKGLGVVEPMNESRLN